MASIRATITISTAFRTLRQTDTGGIFVTIAIVAIQSCVAVVIDAVGAIGFSGWRWTTTVIRTGAQILIRIARTIAAVRRWAAVNRTIGVVLRSFTGPVTTTVTA